MATRREFIATAVATTGAAISLTGNLSIAQAAKQPQKKMTTNFTHR